MYSPTPAETIIHGGRIATLDRARPFVSALAIARGRVLAIGDLDRLAAHRTDATVMIDVQDVRSSQVSTTLICTSCGRVSRTTWSCAGTVFPRSPMRSACCAVRPSGSGVIRTAGYAIRYPLRTRRTLVEASGQSGQDLRRR